MGQARREYAGASLQLELRDFRSRIRAYTGLPVGASIEKGVAAADGNCFAPRKGIIVQLEERQAPRSLWRMIVGWFCLAIGLLGVVLPILPGIPFLVLGIVTLASQYAWARKVMLWGKRRWGKKRTGQTGLLP